MKNLYQISLLAVVLGFSLRAEESQQQQESSAKELMVIQLFHASKAMNLTVRKSFWF